MGGLIILYVSIDKDSLPADDNDGKENQDALENISDCLNRMSIGSWPSLPSAKKPAADKSALERTEDLCKESACVSSKWDDLQQTELTLTGRCGRLETEIEVEKLRCAWKNVRKEDLLAKLHSSQKEYDQLGKRHDEVVKEVRELNDKYAAVKSDYKLYKAKYEQSQSNLQAAEGNIFDLREDMVAEKARAKALQRKVNQLNTMVNSLKKYIAKTC
ncbi:hypothetical protein H4R22_005313 [Coemansia sp. RSA 1290]|nr:hypothetical protein H4R22_005313 [Coemansia sp. RSA 1290]KAJ2650088.1 hypothetical protein IWW40_002634 [Coemansia sp. RSA 1250]